MRSLVSSTRSASFSLFPSLPPLFLPFPLDPHTDQCAPSLAPNLSFRSLRFTSRMNSSRKRANEDEGDVTYINDANKVFNKKINRYYDRYTKEIRANFERGTAL